MLAVGSKPRRVSFVGAAVRRAARVRQNKLVILPVALTLRVCRLFISSIAD